MWRLKNRSEIGGMSLIELIISLSMLSLLLLLIFATFELGTRLFRDTSVRQSSEMDLRGIKLMLERDINLSNFWQSNVAPREISGNKRDALSLVSLNNWDDPANYDPGTKRPAWNRYIVWYATSEPKGRLVRQAVDPPTGGSPFNAPYGALSTNLSDDPLTNEHVVYSRELTDNLREFQAETRFQNGTIRARIRLQASGGKRPQSMENTEDHLEVTMTFQPKNSWPAI